MVGAVVLRSSISRVGEFLSSGQFAFFALTLVGAWTAAMGVMILWPENFSEMASFAASFRAWCFGYDPLTGKFSMAKLALMVLDPIFFALLLGVVWGKSSIRLPRERPKLAAALATIAIGIVVSVLYGVSQADFAMSASGERIQDYQLIRSSDSAPTLELTDHAGKPYSLQSGKVTVVSAFYTHCVHTCPQIIEQAKQALRKAGVDPTSVDVAMITLDPENDDVVRLGKKAEALKLDSNWHLLTGDPKAVNAALDRFKVARVRDEKGNIGHSNLFYVVDRKGRLAFTIGLGTTQEVWLGKALKLLVREGA